MKYISAELRLLKSQGHRPLDRALDLLNAPSSADSAIELAVMQTYDERRFTSRTLSCRAGVRDVEPVKRHYRSIRDERILA